MPLRSAIIALALLVVAPAVATAQAPPAPVAPVPAPAPTIAPGTAAGGIDLSGLDEAAATVKLATTLTLPLTRDLVLHVGARRFRRSARTLGVSFDPGLTARRALRKPSPHVPLAVTHDPEAVDGLVAQAAKATRRRARDATLRITLRKLILRRAVVGRRLDTVAATTALNAALDTVGKRQIRIPVTKVRPATNADDLRRADATVITVDKAHFKLRLFKNLKYDRSYGVAVGQPAYPTPSGLFAIQSKQVDPVWSVPNSPWAGELQGTTVEGGSAANPLKARWMGIVNGVGIHGTGEDGSIGTRASHGCIRMHVADVKDLYSRVPVGTPVLIA